MEEIIAIIQKLPEEKRKQIMPVLISWLNDGAVGGLWKLELLARMVGLTLSEN